MFKVLDLFCKAGGASYGMFWVDPVNISITGVDNVEQKSYPFKFIKADYREVDLSDYNFIWASPPCQRFSKCTAIKNRINHEDHIETTREILIRSGKPYTMENVPGAPLHVDLILKGEYFNLKFKKKRIFETSFMILSPGSVDRRAQYYFTGSKCPMGIGYKEKALDSHVEWMNYDEYNNHVPPEYSYYILKYYLDNYYNKN